MADNPIGDFVEKWRLTALLELKASGIIGRGDEEDGEEEDCNDEEDGEEDDDEDEKNHEEDGGDDGRYGLWS